jgi:hypothetical protein
LDGITTPLAANDDSSTVSAARLPDQLLWTHCWRVYVNNNGNITLSSPQSIYTPYGLRGQCNSPSSRPSSPM